MQKWKRNKCNRNNRNKIRKAQTQEIERLKALDIGLHGRMQQLENRREVVKLRCFFIFKLLLTYVCFLSCSCSTKKKSCGSTQWDQKVAGWQLWGIMFETLQRAVGKWTGNESKWFKQM
jgi:hypothetical protein